MNSLKAFVRRTSILREVFLFLFRAKIGTAYLFVQLGEVLTWLFRSRESANFTYELASLISDI